MKVSFDDIEVNQEFGYNDKNYRKINEVQALILGRRELEVEIFYKRQQVMVM